MNELEEKECAMISGMDPPTKQDKHKTHEGIQLKLMDLTHWLHHTADNLKDVSQPDSLFGDASLGGLGKPEGFDPRSEARSSDRSEYGGWATPETVSTTCELAWAMPNKSFGMDSTSSQDMQSNERMLEPRNLDKQLKEKMIMLISRLKHSD